MSILMRRVLLLAVLGVAVLSGVANAELIRDTWFLRDSESSQRTRTPEWSTIPGAEMTVRIGRRFFEQEGYGPYLISRIDGAWRCTSPTPEHRYDPHTVCEIRIVVGDTSTSFSLQATRRGETVYETPSDWQAERYPSINPLPGPGRYTISAQWRTDSDLRVAYDSWIFGTEVEAVPIE